MESREIEEITGCRLNDLGAPVFEVRWKKSWVGENLVRRYINGDSNLISQMNSFFKDFQGKDKTGESVREETTCIKTEPCDEYRNDETTLFICNICNRTFESHSSLQMHQATCVTLVSNDNCRSYDMSHDSISDAAPHNIHRKPVSDIVNELRRSRAQEQNISHEAPTPQNGIIKPDTPSQTVVGVYECENCHMTFADAEYLARHKTRCKNHAFSAIRCEICNRGFTTKGSLDLHIDAVHLKKKEFGCSICGKQFARKHILKVHLTTHTGQCDFQCAVCGKSFKQKSNLNRHERIHESKNFGYRCRFCGQAFTQNKHLKKHMSVMHPSKEISTKPEQQCNL